MSYAVPYGQHGMWGLYREGIKEMTTKVADGVLGAGDAAKLLSEEGVVISACRLAKIAKSAPGQSPAKAGKATLIARHREEEIAKELRFIRAHDLPYTKSMVKASADSFIAGTPDAETFPTTKVESTALPSRICIGIGAWPRWRPSRARSWSRLHTLHYLT